MIPFEETDRAIKIFYSKCELAISLDGKRFRTKRTVLHGTPYRTNTPRVNPFMSETNKEKLKKYLDDKANKIFIHELIRKYT